MVTSAADRITVASTEGQRAQPSARRLKGARKRKPWAAFWLLLPASTVVIAFTVIPVGYLVYMSFTNYDEHSLFTGLYNWVGFSQYRSIFQSSAFWWSVFRTIGFTFALVAGTVLVGMTVAELLTRVTTAIRLGLTVVLVIAWAMPSVASAVVWNWMFEPGYGIVNWVLTQLRIFGNLVNLSWANNATLAYACIWMLVVWESVPFIALLLYAARMQIGTEHLEAARIDGASEWRVYRSVTLPFIRPALLIGIVLSAIWDFNIFNEIWLISNGGPNNATSTLGVWTYKVAFVSFDIGQGAAIAVVTTLLIAIFVSVYIRRLLQAGEDL